MIRLTRAGEYAIRAVLHLAEMPEGQIIDRESVALAQKIPLSFLSKILQRLSAQGIIKSYKGASGGFCLSKSPKEITMLEVLKAIEGPVAFNQCLLEKSDCDQTSICPIHPVWRRLQDSFEHTLSNVTFSHLTNGGPPDELFHIISKT